MFVSQLYLKGNFLCSSPTALVATLYPITMIHPQELISSQWAHQNYYSSSTCLYYPISLLSPPIPALIARQPPYKPAPSPSRSAELFRLCSRSSVLLSLRTQINTGTYVYFSKSGMFRGPTCMSVWNLVLIQIKIQIEWLKMWFYLGTVGPWWRYALYWVI